MKQCVTTLTFVVLVSGRPQGGWIHSQRGIRQGCPLAPLLFILAADALAVCTSQLCRSGAFAGFQSSNILGGIPLLQYADDMTFFIQGSWAAAHTLSIMMDIFSDFSGPRLNRAKSSFIGFSRTSGSGRPVILVTLVLGVEKPNSVEDTDLRLAPSPSATDDEILLTTHGPQLRRGLHVVRVDFGEL